MSTLGTIFKDNWKWRSQIVQLAVFDLKKQSRGAVLGWAWFFIKPTVYVFCFWFAIDIGLRASHADPNGAPFVLWLTAGIIPWFFMRDMLNGGIDVYHRYSYLVTKVKFPLCGITSVFELSTLLLQLMYQVVLIAIYFLCGQPFDLCILQVPVILALMYVFWYFFSILMSPVCAFSRDVRNMMSSLSTPFFWLSGVIFQIHNIDIEWVQTALYFNPITFFVTAFRDAVYYRTWVWDDPMLLIGFAIVFVITAVLGLIVYRRTNKEVSDVL